MKTLTRPIGLTTMLVFGLSFTMNAISLQNIYKKLAPLTKSVQLGRVSNNQITCLVTRPPIISHNGDIEMEYYYCSKDGFTDSSNNKWFFGGSPIMFDNKSNLVLSDRNWLGWIDLVYSEKNSKEVKSLITLMRENHGNEIGFAKFLLDNNHLPRKNPSII